MGFAADQMAKSTSTSVKTVSRIYRHLHIGELGDMAAVLNSFRATGPDCVDRDQKPDAGFP